LSSIHQPETLIRLFDQTFYASENTRLIRGGDEPIYLPAHADCPYHQIVFAHGFFASALHEIAHWCIAGKSRRQLVDYGYWYEPDGRCVQTQAAFTSVEARPQAVEWVLAKACHKSFVVSLDNLSLELDDFSEFKQAILTEIQTMREQGLPPRALVFQQALAKHYQQAINWHEYAFSRAELD